MILSGLLIFFVPTILTLLLFYRTYKYLLSSKQPKNYILIKDYVTFSKFIQDLKNAKQIGVDTEHFQNNTYKGILCLIQIHIPKYPFAIIIDLIELLKEEKIDDKNKIYNELRNIFENKKIEKIFHSCYNDLKWISEAINTSIRNIFDTQYMDNYIETKRKNRQVSQNKNLNNLLKKYLNMKISEEEKKKLQKSDWLSRPLSEDQLNYAANDALYLIKLRQKMYDIINNDKEFNKIKKEFNFEMYNKIISRKNKKEEDFKDIAINYIDENMTVLTENEYIKLAKDIFIDLLKKADDFAAKNNLNREKILSLNSIFHICNKLPKNKEKIIKIINQQQNLSINYDDLINDSKDYKSSEENNINNETKKFYVEIIEYILSKGKEIEETLSKHNLESSKSKNIIEGKKLELLRNLKKEVSKKSVVNNSICKGPIYDSCKMLAPDGQQLCFCDFKKMSWYLERKLAKLVSNDPPVFKLIFEPNARGCVDENFQSSNFYIVSRTNCCVICGKTENYLRFHVIPILYRSCFPENLKSHKSHDVVLLCLDCHEMARKVYEQKKEEISKRYGVPINVMSDGKNNFLKLTQFIKKCKVIKKNKNKNLPEIAEIKLKKNLKENFDTLMQTSEEFKNFVEKNKIKCEKEADIDDNFLNIFCDKFVIDEKNIPEGKKNLHGKLVIEKVKDLKEFIMEWRQFFLDSFQPKFLPKEWSVKHEIVRTFGEYSNFRNEKNFVDNKTVIK